MRKISLRIQYIGSAYSGWQKQINSTTIQQTIEEAIHELTGEDVILHGAGRTDAGVHALDQYALFLTGSHIPAEGFKFALNSKLPQDIRIMESSLVLNDWHPRFSAHFTSYRYTIETAPIVSPFHAPYVWPLRFVPELNKLNELADKIIGYRDFSCFCSTGSKVENKSRNIVAAFWRQEDTRFYFTIKGNGFLYHMVRLLVGTQIELITGKLTEKEFEGMLNNPFQASPATFCAPARGLCLYQILYEDL